MTRKNTALKGGLASVFAGSVQTAAGVKTVEQAPESVAVGETPPSGSAAVTAVEKKPRKTATAKIKKEKKPVVGGKKPGAKIGSVSKKKQKAPVAQAVAKEELKKERNQAFSLQIPESQHERLKTFVDKYAKRSESMTQILLSGLDMKLEELEKREGIYQKR